MALLIDPTNFNESKYPDDAKARAKAILNDCGGRSIGAYSDAAGIEIIRHHAAEYITNRDGGIPACWKDIYLSTGASQAITSVMKLFIREIDGNVPGIMVPIPQYPIFTATADEYGMHKIGYYLNEDTNWGLDVPELERALNEAKEYCNPRAIVVINPGNPTGQVLTYENIQNVIKFAHKHHLFILADEVYQDNVYDKESAFHSFKKVLFELGEPYNRMELASFMSSSKGYMGECGMRGGYVELINLDPSVRQMYQKLISAQLCPTTIGQAALDVVVNPPKESEPSYEQWRMEKMNILESLKERAKLVSDSFNSFDGISCNTVQGALYAFPQLHLPPKAIEAAKHAGQPADTFYGLQLLEETGIYHARNKKYFTSFFISCIAFFLGICVVAGSEFGQKPGTYHFRTTILPQMDKLQEMLSKFEEFHQKFMAKYE